MGRTVQGQAGSMLARERLAAWAEIRATCSSVKDGCRAESPNPWVWDPSQGEFPERQKGPGPWPRFAESRWLLRRKREGRSPSLLPLGGVSHKGSHPLDRAAPSPRLLGACLTRPLAPGGLSRYFPYWDTLQEFRPMGGAWLTSTAHFGGVVHKAPPMCQDQAPPTTEGQLTFHCRAASVRRSSAGPAGA